MSEKSVGALHAMLPKALIAKVDVLCTMLSLNRSQLVERALRAELAAVEQMPEAKLAFKALESFQSAAQAKRGK